MIKILLFLLFTTNAVAQLGNDNGLDGDLEIGGDIFSDFNEDLEASQVMEDERFYRYGRFFGVMMGLGATTFTGNRGTAYEDNHPSFNLGVFYFMDFQNAFVLGISFSSHTMLIDTFVNGSPNEIIGAVETTMLRPYAGFRYYLDTSDLGTAITYSNPYVTARIEYWYQTNQFPESSLSDEQGGGLGTGIGAGLEFPIEIKESYINIEVLYHFVTFQDENTQDYRQIEDPSQLNPGDTSEYGYEDLTGDALSIMINYNISW